jgi:hypothetical protein
MTEESVVVMAGLIKEIGYQMGAKIDPSPTPSQGLKMLAARSERSTSRSRNSKKKVRPLKGPNDTEGSDSFPIRPEQSSQAESRMSASSSKTSAPNKVKCRKKAAG